MISASLCFSIDFKWGQEISFQRKTQVHKLNGFNIWELTAGNMTGRCNSGYPAAELLGFDKKTILGLSMPEGPGDWKDPGPARELFQVFGQGMNGLCTTFLPLWDTGSTDCSWGEAVPLSCLTPCTAQNVPSLCQLLPSTQAGGKGRLFQPRNMTLPNDLTVSRTPGAPAKA